MGFSKTKVLFVVLICLVLELVNCSMKTNRGIEIGYSDFYLCNLHKLLYARTESRTAAREGAGPVILQIPVGPNKQNGREVCSIAL